MSGGEPPTTRPPRAGIVAVAAAAVGAVLLLIPPSYSSDVTGIEVTCGVPLFFDEDTVSRDLRESGEAGETALLIAAECHERVTGRIAGAVLTGLVGVGALGIASVARRRRER